MFKLKELKHGSKFKKLVENPDHEKIIDLLTAEQGKWEATRKNPHYAINRGSLTDSCHGRVSGINKICIRSSSYCRSQATAA